MAGYFFLLGDFLAAGFVTLDFCGFDLVDLSAIMLLRFWLFTPLRHVSFPAEELSMATGAATVNPRLMHRRTVRTVKEPQVGIEAAWLLRFSYSSSEGIFTRARLA